MAMKWEPASFGYMDSNPVKPLVCNFCGFAAGSSLEYQNHTLTHMSGPAGSKKNQGVEKKPKIEKPDEKPRTCSYCLGVFNSAAALKKHVKELHSEEKVPPKRTKLDVMKGVSSSDFLAELQKPKKRAKKEDAACPVCQMVVSSLKELKMHICVRSSGPSWNPFESGNSNPFFPFKCTLCDYSASTQMDLDNHALSHGIRVNESIFTKSKTEMDVAKPKQEEEKSLKCPFNCGYKGARDDLLKAHLERKHGALSASKPLNQKDIAPPKAQLQAKPSKKLPSQPAKQVKATPQMEEKAFKCGMCDYAGATKENFKGHMQRMHGATDNKSKRKGEDKNAGQTVVMLSGGSGLAVQVKVGNGGKPKKK